MLTRLTPLQLVKLAVLGAIIYGVFSVAALFNSHGPHEYLINLALIPMCMGVTLFGAAWWRVRRGLSRQAYTFDQLSLVEAWAHGGIFRWSMNVIMFGGLAGASYTAFAGVRHTTFFTTLAIVGISLSTLKDKLGEATEPEPQSPAALPIRPGTTHGLHSDHWGSQGWS